jgi:hypothetical protein
MAKLTLKDLIAEEKREVENDRLEEQASRFLKRCGFRRDGRPASDTCKSVRVVYHHNG